MILLATLFLLTYVAFSGLILGQIYKGNTAYLLLYIICFLPFYSVFQLIIFNAFENTILVNSIKYSKDFIFYSSFILFLLGSNKSILQRTFSFSTLDKLILIFLMLVVLYLIIPIGEAFFCLKLFMLRTYF